MTGIIGVINLSACTSYSSIDIVPQDEVMLRLSSLTLPVHTYTSLEDERNPFPSRRAVVLDCEEAPLADRLLPETQLNAQCLAAPRRIIGRQDAYNETQLSMFHQLKNNGPTSHVNSKVILILMSMSMDVVTSLGRLEQGVHKSSTQSVLAESQ